MNIMWMYSKDNKSTWKYLDHRKLKKGLIWCQNPDFAYLHISPFDENSLPIEEFKKIP